LDHFNPEPGKNDDNESNYNSREDIIYDDEGQVIKTDDWIDYRNDWPSDYEIEEVFVSKNNSADKKPRKKVTNDQLFVNDVHKTGVDEWPEEFGEIDAASNKHSPTKENDRCGNNEKKKNSRKTSWSDNLSDPEDSWNKKDPFNSEKSSNINKIKSVNSDWPEFSSGSENDGYASNDDYSSKPSETCFSRKQASDKQLKTEGKKLDGNIGLMDRMSSKYKSSKNKKEDLRTRLNSIYFQSKKL